MFILLNKQKYESLSLELLQFYLIATDTTFTFHDKWIMLLCQNHVVYDRLRSTSVLKSTSTPQIGVH